MQVQHQSALLVTLDSCRYDTFDEAEIPNLKSVGKFYRAMAPGTFTYSSHAAMFVGFTPGIAELAEPWLNPKFGKFFRIAGASYSGKPGDRFLLEGRNIADGFKRKGYLTVGSGAVSWFDPKAETGMLLSQDFNAYYYPGNTWSVRLQVSWLLEQFKRALKPVFAFLNVGETHVPYFHEGAAWDLSSPCVPFSDRNDADECRRRQRACLEFVDQALQPLLETFRDASIIVCADHGDCWGEDGLWQHGFHHTKVVEVPLVFRIAEEWRPSPGL
jgi:membrane-anchored protein YejM (alkaline phosphatase superfamily)